MVAVFIVLSCMVLLAKGPLTRVHLSRFLAECHHPHRFHRLLSIVLGQATTRKVERRRLALRRHYRLFPPRLAVDQLKLPEHALLELGRLRQTHPRRTLLARVAPLNLTDNQTGIVTRFIDPLKQIVMTAMLMERLLDLLPTLIILRRLSQLLLLLILKEIIVHLRCGRGGLLALVAAPSSRETVARVLVVDLDAAVDLLPVPLCCVAARRLPFFAPVGVEAGRAESLAGAVRRLRVHRGLRDGAGHGLELGGVLREHLLLLRLVALVEGRRCPDTEQGSVIAHRLLHARWRVVSEL